MPTVIDSLLVQLGLDPKPFQQGQAQSAASLKKLREDAAGTAKEMQASGKRAAEMFSAIKTEVLSLAGVLLGTAGIGALTATSAGLRQLGKDANSIGLPVGDVAAFAQAIQLLGGSYSGAVAALQSFASAKAKAKLGGDPQFIQEMGLIGGNMDTSEVEAMKLLQSYIEKFKGQPGGIQQIEAIANKLFPNIDHSVLQAMETAGTLDVLNQKIARANELGVPTPEQIAQSAKLAEAFTALEQAGEGVGRTLLTDVAPALTAVTNAITNLIVNNPKGTEAIAGIVTALTALSGLKILSTGLNLAGLTGLGGVLGEIAVGLNAILRPLAAIAVIYEGFHIGGLNEGEDAELKRLRAAHGMTPDGRGGSAGTNGGGNLSAPLPPDIEAEVRRQAVAQGLDPDHMARLAQKEGGGYGNVSPAGAFGPMQLMPGTGAQYGVTPASPWQSNISAGLAYYKSLLDQFGGNVAAADAAYNAGPNNPGVKRFAATGDKSGLPAETRDYVDTINGAPRLPAAAASGSRPVVPPPPTPIVTSSQTHNNNSTQVSIGQIGIQTQATDAGGIARDLSAAIVAQSNRGAQ